MTIFDINDTDKICDSKQVRIACGNPTDPTWRKYRKKVGIKSNAKLLTLRESFLVWCCANLHRTGKRGWTLIKISAAANQLLAEKPSTLQAIATFSGSEGVKGKDLMEAIEPLIGRTVHRTTLYRAGKRGDKTPLY